MGQPVLTPTPNIRAGGARRSPRDKFGPKYPAKPLYLNVVANLGSDFRVCSLKRVRSAVTPCPFLGGPPILELGLAKLRPAAIGYANEPNVA